MNIPVINTINVMTYRPSNTRLSEFNNIPLKIEEILKGLDKSEPIVKWTGDF